MSGGCIPQRHHIGNSALCTAALNWQTLQKLNSFSDLIGKTVFLRVLHASPGNACRTGLFEGVDAKVKPMKKGKSQVRFLFKEKVWPEMQSFRVSPSGQPPPHTCTSC